MGDVGMRFLSCWFLTFMTSYILLELGESPMGTGQKKADWKPASLLRSPRWMAYFLF